MIGIDRIKQLNKKFGVFLLLFTIYTGIFIYELIYSPIEEQLSKGIGWIIFSIGIFLFKNKFNEK